MITQILIIAVSIFISAIIVSYSLPKIMLFSLRKRMLDNIDSRKVHTSIASRLGGAAFFPAIILAIIIATTLETIIGGDDFKIQSNLLMELGCIMVLYIIGLADDAINVRYRTKFQFQFLTAFTIICTGNYLQGFNGFMGIEHVDYYITIPLTMVLFVFITNAINLIDGIDGLASMLSIMALGAYGTMFYLNQDYIDSIFCFVSMSSLMPFFYHNVFGIRKRMKAKIFMGDGGALVIGFILAIMSVKLWNMPYTGSIEQKHISVLSWIISFTMLLIPCFDAVRVVLHRARNKQPLFLPDKNHFHHKLIAYGFTTRQALYIIVLINVIYLFLNLLLYKIGVNFTLIVLIDIISWTVLHIYLTTKINKTNV